LNGPAPSPLLQQGSALLAGGRFHEALAAFGQALREAPDGYDARLGLARACAGAGDPLAAAAWLNDAARIQPASPEPLHLLAELLLGLKLYAQALPVYRRLFDGHGARDQATVLHLAYSLEQVGALDEAALRYREALAAWPDFLEAHVDLAGMLWRIGDFAGAMAHAQRSVELAPQHPHALRILGTAHLNLGRVEEAEALFRRALELKPGFPLAELDLAFTLLGAGRLREGWQWYARRWNDVDRLRRPPRGRRLLVYAEQGLGDVIQFCRYVPLLQRAGATVLGVVQPELVALLEHSFPGFTCLTADRHLQADAHVALLDLPLHLGTDTLADIPAPEAYLQAPRDKVAAWGERLRPWAGKLKVGLAWCGFQGQMNNRNRAMALGACPCSRCPACSASACRRATPAPGPTSCRRRARWSTSPPTGRISPTVLPCCSTWTWW
jgi:tetratricopeptide (TPR) repeat protein